MPARRSSRPVLIAAAVLLVGGGLAWAFWPRPVALDFGAVTRGAMALTIDEEGRTRVRETYLVSTPVDGRLLRVDGNPGDPVVKGKTVVARMRPARTRLTTKSRTTSRFQPNGSLENSSMRYLPLAISP